VQLRPRGNKEFEGGDGETLLVGSLRAMCDSSIRNKKFSSADWFPVSSLHSLFAL
jgi:hypothetical protein